MAAVNRAAWTQLKNLPPAVWWVSATTLINRMGSMVFPFLLLYFHRSLGIELEEAASIVACYGVGSSLAAPAGGWAADRFDCIRLLTLALGLCGSIMVCFPLIAGKHALMATTFALAFVTDLTRPSTMTALARFGGQQSRDAFTLNYLAINLGMSFGPILGGYLAVHNYRWLFWVDGGSSLLACLLLLRSGMRCPPPGPHSSTSAAPVRGGALQLLACLVLCLWVFMTFFSAVPVYAVEVLHVPESAVGWMWLINTLVIVLTTVQLNHWTRTVPLTRLLTIAALLFSGCYVAMACLSGAFGFVVALLCLTFAEMLLFPNITAYLQQVVPPSRMGRAMAMNAICGSLATAAAAPTVGYFFTHRTPHELWITLACVGLFAALGFRMLPPPAE